MRKPSILSSILFVSIVAAGAPALAQQPATTLTQGKVPPGAHLHDGFYLRLGTGFGGYSETIGQEDADETTQVTGLASVSELAIGGAVRPGLIFGGGFWGSSVLASDRTIQGAMPPAEVMSGSGNFTLMGPFCDWYFNARRGMHLQMAVGFATVRGWDLPEAQNHPDAVSLGAGAMIGFGYEWWVSDEWSFGILARVAGVGAIQQDEANTTWVHAVGSSPSFVFTATFN